MNPRNPLHVTLRLERELGNLRFKTLYAVIREAIRRARERLGARIVHYSVQRDHIHLLFEAESRDALMRAAKGLSVRIARALNRAAGRKGRAFGDRYHYRSLDTPREVRNTLAYVLQNARKHAAERGRARPRGWIDPCSSADAFGGWSNRKPRARDDVAGPKTWLMKVGWWVHGGGLIHTGHVPAS